jgi:uncharacterized membrane protein
VRRVPGGEFTDHIFDQVQEKSILRIQGPLGTFVLRETSQRPMIFIGGGTGFAPIKGLLEHALAGDMRWLRPHGLLPHPNIWAGFIGAGLFASAYAYLRGWRWALLLVGFGWWLLLMSFSRGAWLGFGAATLMSLPFLWRMFGWRRLIPIVSLLVILGVVFVLMYAPLLNARTGAGQENTEMRSIADRIVYTQIALDAIQTAPLQGIGAGQLPLVCQRLPVLPHRLRLTR